MVIYVIGFMGSDREGAAAKVSEEKGLPLYDLDREIEKRDGRSIQRLVMTMGEHELRNKEYETLAAILEELGETAPRDDLPMICSRCAHEEETATVAAAAGNLSERFKGSDEPVAVVCCNDAVVLDPMSHDIIEAGEVVFVDDDPEVLWENTRDRTDLPYAFLLDKDEARKKEKFLSLYAQRHPVYEALAQNG